MLPPNIQTILNEISIVNSPFQFETRKGTASVIYPYEVLQNRQKVDQLLDSWNAFHGKIAYQNWEQFYNKERFCDDIEKLDISQDSFIELICDRTFLFLSYSEHLSSPDYPELKDVYKNPEIMTAHYKGEQIELIKRQGFIPTRAHYWEWEQWTKSVKQLNLAIERRKAHILQGANIDKKISWKKYEEAFTPCDLEDRIARLFHKYLSALIDMAYGTEYQALINKAFQNSLTWIHTVMENSKMNEEEAPCTALLLWVLFTTYTKKLASGTLKEYKFAVPNRKSTKDQADVSPAKLNGNQSQKIRCNIILFDHLLDIVQPKDREYAKFQFYAFARYDRFTHYRTKPDRPFDFNCIEEELDCVDQLGGMIRYHIEHCLMNTPAWLSLAVPSLSSKPLMNSLAALLLHDATLLPTKRRLTERVQFFMKDAKANNYVEQYEQCGGNEERITRLLDRLREEEDLHFIASHVFMDSETLNDPNIAQCERFVVEYALKEKQFEFYYAKLRDQAMTLFPREWFLSKFLFI